MVLELLRWMYVEGTGYYCVRGSENGALDVAFVLTFHRQDLRGQDSPAGGGDRQAAPGR